MTKRAKVALLIDTATSWGSGLIEGIAEYAHAHQDWQCFLGPRGKYDRSILPDNWDGDGVIARVTHQELADQLIAKRIPAVNVSWYRYGEGQIPRCTCDEVTIAETVEELNRENAVQREKIVFLEQQLTELKRTEATLSNTLGCGSASSWMRILRFSFMPG